MVGTDVAFVPAVVIGLQDFQDAGVSVAVPVTGLGEVPVGEVLDIADMGKGDTVTMAAYYVGKPISKDVVEEKEIMSRLLQEK